MGSSPDLLNELAAAETLPLGFPKPKPAPAPAPLRIPETVGRYEVRGLLGEGTMGRVFRAYDARAGREVAVRKEPVAMVSTVCGSPRLPLT